MKNNRRLKMDETLDTVKRERELYSSELGFVNCAKNTIKVNNTNLRINRLKNNIKGWLYAKIGI